MSGGSAIDIRASTVKKILLEIVNVDKNACYEFLAPIHAFRFRVKKDYTRDKSPFSHAQGSEFQPRSAYKCFTKKGTLKTSSPIKTSHPYY